MFGKSSTELFAAKSLGNENHLKSDAELAEEIKAELIAQQQSSSIQEEELQVDGILYW